MNTFSWERKYKRTWENLEKTVKDEKISLINFNSSKKGIIRHFHIIIDLSDSIELNDFLPSFRFHICKDLKIFIKKFYKENPLSILSLITYRNNKSDKYRIINLNNLDFIDKIFSENGIGNFSLMNAIKDSLIFLKNDYLKEILIITCSIFTINNVNIKYDNIKIHFLSFRGEIYFFQKICEKSNGKYFVPEKSENILMNLEKFCVPNVLNSSSSVNLLKIGFPEICLENTVCACHFQSKNGFICPICKTKVCLLPCICPICKTQLCSNNIVQSLYYCYPLKEFEKIENENFCKICELKATERCSNCKTEFCTECSNFMHTDLCFCVYCGVDDSQ